MSFSHPIRNNVVFFKHSHWVVTSDFFQWASEMLEGSYQIENFDNYQRPVNLIFDREHDAVAYELAWQEPWTAINTVMLNTIRRVMPTIIANDIIGVSPMTGPVTQIFSLNPRYMKSDTNDL